MLTRRLAARSALWSVVLQWSRFGLNTIVFLLLTRLLTLEEIGAFAVAFACVRVVQVVQRTGFVEAIAQEGESDPELLNSLLWISAGFGCAAGAVLFGVSYVIDAAVGVTGAGDYLAAMAAIPALLGVSVVSEGILLRRLDIRGLAVRSIVSLGIAGVGAVALGFQGYGGWALTGFAIVNMGLAAVFAIGLAAWRPSGPGSLAAARRALPIVFSVSGRNLANAFVMPALQLIVGGALGAGAAGAFQIAQRFLTLAETMAISPMRYIALPLFARVKEDPARLGRAIIEALSLLSLMAVPVYFGLLAVTDTILPLVVGPTNAAPTAPMLQAMLLFGGVAGVIAICNQALTAVGRPIVALKRAILSLALNIATAFVMATHSGVAVSLGYAATAYLTAPLLIAPVMRSLRIRPRDMLAPILKPLVSGLVMVGAVVALPALLPGGLAPVLILTAQVLTGVATYGALCFLISRRELAAALAHVRSMRRGGVR